LKKYDLFQQKKTLLSKKVALAQANLFNSHTNKPGRTNTKEHLSCTLLKKYENKATPLIKFENHLINF